jgi:hypothetical protein
MSKKILVLALSLAATVLLAAGSSFGQACSTGITVQYVGIGSSAQFNTLAYGAFDTISAQSGITLPINVWSSGTSEVVDMRITPNTVDKGLKTWVIYDSGATCSVYVGYQADSVQGVKDFYCYGKNVAPRVGLVADCIGYNDPNNQWQLAACANEVAGLPCTTAGSLLPTDISTFLVTQPIPSCTGTCSNKTQALPAAYCGSQSDDSAGTVGTATQYCYFNAAHTDIREEDALYATTRALSSYNTTNSLYGLGYNQAACGSTGTTTKTVGCPIFDSFGQGKVFYPLNFALKGADPYTAATPVPAGTTITLGAAPVVVFVNNADSTSSYGFGVGQPTNYLHHDVLHKVLAQIFEGVDSCTGDLLPSVTSTGAFSGAYGGSIPGAGQPIQAVVREPLSGTYNTFEFTGVRTFSGSGLNAQAPTGVMIGLNKITTATTTAGPSWQSDQESSQEDDVRNNLPTGPATGWTSGTNSANCSPTPNGSQNCGDPLYNETGSVDSTSACGTGVKARAIGTGEEVSATLASFNSVTGGLTPGWTIKDGIGYAFWGYSNFKPACSGTVTNAGGGVATCSVYTGHYLTVDSIDPFFNTEGGGYPLTVAAPAIENPNGANNFPQCAAVDISGAAFPCPQIPFPHIYDGKYPLWTFYRIVTFANITTKTATQGTVTTPQAVLNVVANAEIEAAPGSTKQLSDFVPFLNSLTQNGTTGAWTGNLNLGVFRVHYLNSATPPNNGHSGCAPFTPGVRGDGSFTGVSLQGGTTGHTTCLVDAGGDVGGTVKTVQADVDYYLDLGGAAINGVHYPLELYNLHQ